MLIHNLRTDVSSPIRSTSDAQAFALIVAALCFAIGTGIESLTDTPPTDWSLHALASLAGVAGIALLVAYPLALLIATNFLALFRAKRKLANLEATDSLTGLRTRRAMMADFSALTDRCGVLLILDIDRFQLINDTFGPVKGDRVLTRLARLLAEEFSDLGPIYRTGSDEFILLAIGHRISDVRNRVCAATMRIEQAEFGGDGEHIGASLSGGMLTITAEAELHSLLAQANAALTLARTSGRGRVVAADRLNEMPGLVDTDQIAWSGDDRVRPIERGRRHDHGQRLGASRG
jgi:diguanylate cyclase (GGDEF)-like protein